jgi:catechol 2,3-dioxygenase-like lactoylglutathione lyase family enzyme
MSRGYQIRALGEVAIRCRDLEAMRAFYRDVVGLAPLEGDCSGNIAFFQIAPGFGGHTTVLALFADGAPETGAASSLHHVALTVSADEQPRVEAWLRAQGLSPRTQDFPWIGWRGLFVTDPEGNTVEFVASVGADQAARPPSTQN